jgi:hypothetical protein
MPREPSQLAPALSPHVCHCPDKLIEADGRRNGFAAGRCFEHWLEIAQYR